MSQKYQTGVRFNHHLGPLETLSFMGEGVGASLYGIAVLTEQWWLAALGILFVLGAVIALLNHLGNPMRSWRAITRVATSWVSRGTLTMAVFLGVATLSVAAVYLESLAPYQSALANIALVLAVAVMFYAGMLLRSMRAIRLWRGPLVPLAFVAHSLATALILAWALMSVVAGTVAWLQPAAVVALIASAALSAAHLLRAERSEGVRASFARLFTGDLRASFIFGGGVCGILVPLVALPAVAPLAGSGAAAVMIAVVLCRLYGDFAYRNALVLAGAYEPVVPGWPVRSFNPPAAAPAIAAGGH